MKTKLLFTLLLLLSASIFFGCKKEAGPQGPQGPIGPEGPGAPNPAIYNKWEVLSGSLGYSEGSKYINIYNDNSLYVLSENVYQFKDVSSATALITDNQINIFSTTYNYTIVGDTLKISQLSQKIVCVKNSSAPTGSEWVTEIASLDSMAVPYPTGDPREDIGYDGQYLWMTSGNSSLIYKINLVTKSVEGTIPFNSYMSSVACAQGYLWVSNSDKKIHKIDKTTGNDLQQSPLMASTVMYGVAYDGQYLWCNNAYNDALYKYDPVANTIVSQMSIPYFAGMEFAGSYLYICNGQYIQKCTMSPFKAIKTYKIKSAESQGYGASMGIAYDGTYFWTTIENKYTGNVEIHKLNLN